ncbi:hypothetical protein GCM10023319_76120 [Nocardia iowensis]
MAPALAAPLVIELMGRVTGYRSGGPVGNRDDFRMRRNDIFGQYTVEHRHCERYCHQKRQRGVTEPQPTDESHDVSTEATGSENTHYST